MSSRLPESSDSLAGVEPKQGAEVVAPGSFQPTLIQVGLGTLLTVGIFAYPFLFEWLIARAGVRAGALGLVVYGIFFALVRRAMGIPIQLLSLPHLMMLGIALVTAVTEDLRYLLLVPALIYLMLCKLFLDTLQQSVSMVEHVAKFIVPFAPDFIKPYCRKSTVGWSLFFAVNAVVISWLALTGRVEMWRSYTGWIVFALIGAICAVDFVVRKWWFRYYFHNNLFDRIWSRLFPAEDTRMGRLSMEYIRRKREELGMPPP